MFFPLSIEVSFSIKFPSQIHHWPPCRSPRCPGYVGVLLNQLHKQYVTSPHTIHHCNTTHILPYFPFHQLTLCCWGCDKSVYVLRVTICWYPSLPPQGSVIYYCSDLIARWTSITLAHDEEEIKGVEREPIPASEGEVYLVMSFGINRSIILVPSSVRWQILWSVALLFKLDLIN